MKKNSCLLLLLLFVTGPSLYSQSPGRFLSASVQDSASMKPIRYATVVIKDSSGKVLKSSLTSDSGILNIPLLLPPGRYRLSLSAVGYKAKMTPFVISDTTLPVDLATIVLATASKTLAAVTVVAQPPLVRQEIDRLAFDVQADPESKVTSVLEMLRKVPLVTVDAEDNIQLKGSGNFRILINGKTSALLSGNMKDVLRTMPASTIEKIEIITIPPAKYEAEGLAGIINIITSKKIDDGYKGTVNTYYRVPVTGPGTGASLSVKKGKWGFNFFGGLMDFHSPELQTTTTRETIAPATLLQANNIYRYKGKSTYAGAELSFAPDSLQLITAEFTTSSNSRDNSGRQSSLLTNPQQQVLQSFQLQNEAQNTSSGLGAGINYQLGFKQQKNRLLTFSYKYNRYNSGRQNQVSIPEDFSYPVADYQQANESRFAEQTLQADYTQPLSKNGSLEAGIKGIWRDNESDFRYLSKDSSSGKFSEVPSFTNTFNNTQSIWGFYASFQYAFTNWSVKAGLRTEATAVNADFISTGSGASQHYFNVIPSIALQRKYKNNTSLNMGFTQRIQRPAIAQLNPFVDRSQPNFESTGNPGLRPVLSNNMEISFSRIRKQTLVASISYSFVNNNIQQAVVYAPNTKITRSFYDNIGTEKALVGNINFNWPVSAKCNVSLSGTFGYQWFQGTIDGQLVQNSGIKASFRSSISYSFSKGWRVNEAFNYYSPFVNLQGTTSPYFNPSLSISKDIKQFSFSLLTVNYFSTWLNYKQKTEGANFSQLAQNRGFNRTITMSINYRFGKLTKQLEKNKRGINNDDLSGN